MYDIYTKNHFDSKEEIKMKLLLEFNFLVESYQNWAFET